MGSIPGGFVGVLGGIVQVDEPVSVGVHPEIGLDTRAGWRLSVAILIDRRCAVFGLRKHLSFTLAVSGPGIIADLGSRLTDAYTERFSGP